MIILFDPSAAPLLRRLIVTYLKPHWRKVAKALLLMSIAAGMTALFAKLVQPLLDYVLIAKKPEFLLPIAGGIFMCFVLRGLTNYGHTILMGRIGQDIVSTIQQQVFGHLMRQDLAYFHATPSGDLLTRLTGDVNIMRMAVAEGLTNMGKNSLTLILLIGVMVWQDWRLAIFALTIFPIALFCVARLGKRLRSISHGTQDATSDVAARLTQIFQAMRQVKAFNAEQSENFRMAKLFDDVRRLAIKNVQIGTLSTPINDILVGFIVVGLVIYAGYYNTTLTAGSLMSFITAFLMAYEPLKRIAKTNNTIQTGLGAAQRVFAILDNNPTVTDQPNALVWDGQPATVAFENVGFTYADKPVLTDVSFQVPTGQTVALVGASGAGKSTCFNLALRFYDPNTGTVKLGGHDLRTLTQQSIRAHTALVSQDIVVFDDTVNANLAFGTNVNDPAAIQMAARAAFAHDFIMALPDGYNTRLGENGVTLSGGQRQRIALARAFLKNAPILLLDEATSALDTESERLVQQSLTTLMHNRTTLVIAHRLSTIRHADLILVFDAGQIVESGTHSELLALNGLYAKLYQQFSGT